MGGAVEEVWCARCERTYLCPSPPDARTWLNDHWRFGMCRPPTSREVAEEALDEVTTPEFLAILGAAVDGLPPLAEAQPDGDGGPGYR